MSNKLDHEKYMRDLADNLVTKVHRDFDALRKNCVTCEFFDDKQELCTIFKARPPATVIVKGCDRYENEIPF
jgi:hypothetical protein